MLPHHVVLRFAKLFTPLRIAFSHDGIRLRISLVGEGDDILPCQHNASFVCSFNQTAHRLDFFHVLLYAG